MAACGSPRGPASTASSPARRYPGAWRPAPCRPSTRIPAARVWATVDGKICSAPAEALERGSGSPGWTCVPAPNREPTDFIEVDSGALWAATFDAGMWRLRGGRWEEIPASRELPSRWTSALARSPRGGVWILGEGNFLRVRERADLPGGWEVLERVGLWQGVPTSGVQDVAEAEDGTLWAATNLSLVRIPPLARAARPRAAAGGARRGRRGRPAAARGARSSPRASLPTQPAGAALRRALVPRSQLDPLSLPAQPGRRLVAAHAAAVLPLRGSAAWPVPGGGRGHARRAALVGRQVHRGLRGAAAVVRHVVVPRAGGGAPGERARPGLPPARGVAPEARAPAHAHRHGPPRRGGLGPGEHRRAGRHPGPPGPAGAAARGPDDEDHRCGARAVAVAGRHRVVAAHGLGEPRLAVGQDPGPRAPALRRRDARPARCRTRAGPRGPTVARGAAQRVADRGGGAAQRGAARRGLHGGPHAGGGRRWLDALHRRRRARVPAHVRRHHTPWPRSGGNEIACGGDGRVRALCSPPRAAGPRW